MSENEGANGTKDPRSSLPIEIGTELLIEVVNLSLKIKGTLVGLEYGSYVILRISPKDLVGNFRSEDVLGSAIIVRYLFKGSIYGFKTSIMNTVSNPARTTFRDSAFDGAIVDISLEGGRCVIKRPPGPELESLYNAIDANKTALIKLALPGVDKPIDIKASVRNICKDNDRVSFGGSFDEIAPQGRTHLERFISLISGAGEPA